MELFAKKSLGQHFLASTAAVRHIVEAAKLKKGDRVLEIGPGTGILTEALLAAGGRVIAVEKDVRAESVLARKFSSQIAAGDARFIEGDILSADIMEKLRAEGLREGEYALVANIPYYITGAILELFLETGPRPKRMVLLVQKEVAERIVARGAKESILSISVKSFGDPRIVAVVPRGAFVPAPSVDSAIISIENIAEKSRVFSDKNVDIKGFFKIVRAGFAHKRKYAARNLETLVPELFSAEKLADAWKDSGLDPKVRSENIAPSAWIELARRALEKQDTEKALEP